jgi:hypothetical protein
MEISVTPTVTSIRLGSPVGRVSPSKCSASRSATFMSLTIAHQVPIRSADGDAPTRNWFWADDGRVSSDVLTWLMAGDVLQ